MKHLLFVLASIFIISCQSNTYPCPSFEQPYSNKKPKQKIEKVKKAPKKVVEKEKIIINPKFR